MKRSIVAALLALLVLGCVMRTEHKIDAHITLDIRHIQEQADDVLDYVEGKTDELPEFAAGNQTSWLQRGMQALNPIEVAYAQEMKQDSPRTKEILDAMRENYSAIDGYKRQGCFGENNRGYLELRECDALDSAEAKNEAQRIMAEENEHRKALYSEIARLNKAENVTVGMVERVFANKRLERARSGEKVQLPPSGEAFDQFRNTRLGRDLGGDAQPGAWVVVP